MCLKMSVVVCMMQLQELRRKSSSKGALFTILQTPTCPPRQAALHSACDAFCTCEVTIPTSRIGSSSPPHELMITHDRQRPKMVTVHLLVVAVWIVWCEALQGRAVCPLLRQIALGTVESVHGAHELSLSPVHCLACRHPPVRLRRLAGSARLGGGTSPAFCLCPAHSWLHACLQHARQWPAQCAHGRLHTDTCRLNLSCACKCLWGDGCERPGACNVSCLPACCVQGCCTRAQRCGGNAAPHQVQSRERLRPQSLPACSILDQQELSSSTTGKIRAPPDTTLGHFHGDAGRILHQALNTP